jgi:hypothetical protein
MQNTVSSLHQNEIVCELARRHNLDVCKVTWDDTARSRGSEAGPNISDLTLICNGLEMPVIRKPNFADETSDIPIDNFTVTLGNEGGSALYQATLRSYLEQIGRFTGNNNVP